MGGPLKDVDEFGEAEKEVLDLIDAKFPMRLKVMWKNVFKIGTCFHDL